MVSLRLIVMLRTMMMRSRDAEKLSQNALCGKLDLGDTAEPPSFTNTDTKSEES